MSKKHFLAGIALGAIVGAGFAYIFGTDQGKKLQKDLKKKGKEFVEDLPQDLDDLKAIKKDLVKKSSNLADTIADQAKETVEVAKDTVSEAVGAIKDLTQEEPSPPKPRFFKKNS